MYALGARLYPKNILDMFLVGSKYQLMVKQQEVAGRMLLVDRCLAIMADCRGSK